MVDDPKNDAFTVNIAGTATVVRLANWTVYQDVAHETWTASGYATRTSPSYVYTLINPVTLRQFDPRGKLLAQIEAVRSSTAGKLLPTDSFAQSAYTAWTTWKYTDCCFVSSLRVYHTIPASGVGTSGVNYNETTYGYDSLKRRNRVVSPGGTITRLVHDVRDNVIGTYVGTNDTGATASNPTAGGSGGNTMIQLTASQFDGNADRGDNNLTQQTVFVDASTTRATVYSYDWRNRQVDIDGELNLFQRSFYDNLNRVIKVERRNTTSSGTLVSRNETKFDNRGRVYQTVAYGVDPTTAIVNGNVYDALGRMISTTDRLNHTTTFAFNVLGLQASLTDAEGQTTSYVYDDYACLLRTVWPDMYRAASQVTLTTASPKLNMTF